jgi:hypothetical protein
MATEDIPYNISDFATPDKEEEQDSEQPNKSVLLDALTYIDEAIAEHNTFDVIDLSESAKMTATQQIAVHKLVTSHLRSIKNIINDKVKELR